MEPMLVLKAQDVAWAGTPDPAMAVAARARAAHSRGRLALSHLINPFLTTSPEHARAHAITAAALRNAVDHARRRGLDVEVLAGVFEEDKAAVEAPARVLPALRRSLSDVVSLTKLRRLPLIADLLELACEHGRGEYLIYSNMDISPQPDFYHVVERLLSRIPRRLRALVINRRTISDHYQGPEQLGAMYREEGVPHEGYDCFVFPREWVPRLLLGNLPVGTAGFDQVLVANFEVLSGFRTEILYRQRLTFHLGDDKAWARESELNRFSDQESQRMMHLLRQQCRRIPVRSRFVYVYHVVTKEPPPRASLATRAYNRVKLEFKEYLNTLRIMWIRVGW